MDTESQPSHRDQLLNAIARVLIGIDSFGPAEVDELLSLKEGISSLQDTLWASGEVANPMLPPFYMLCLQLCEAFSGQLSEHNGNISDLKSISVIEYNLSQFCRILLALFHVLSTFLNIRRCIRGKMSAYCYQQCMTCVACAIHDLDNHQAHLKHLNETTLILTQSALTTTCRMEFYQVLVDLDISSLDPIFCKCTARGNNRTVAFEDDVIIIRAGEDALEHCAKFGEQLKEEANRKRGQAEEKDLKGIRIYNDAMESFNQALSRLEPGQELISYETLTRGYKLNFDGITKEELRSLQN